MEGDSACDSPWEKEDRGLCLGASGAEQGRKFSLGEICSLRQGTPNIFFREMDVLTGGVDRGYEKSVPFELRLEAPIFCLS